MVKHQNQIVEVNFHGDRLQAVQDERGVWVSLRRMCEGLGLSESSQRNKLKNKAWACASIIDAHDVTGRQQEAYMLHLDSVPMWLATIETSRVKEEVRFKLELYQRECAKVLADHFFGRKQQHQGVTVEQVAYMIAQTLQTVLPQVLAPIHEVLRQHTAILDRLVNQGGEQRCLGDTVVVRQRIREMWPGASEPKRKAICNEVTSRIRDLGGVVFVQFGRILIERNHLFILDGVIDQMKGRALERETLPLMDISRN